LLAVILGAFSADYFLLPLRASSGHKDVAQYVGLVLYLSVSAGIAVLGGVMHSASLRGIRKLGQTTETLAQTEERLRLTLHSTAVAVWSWVIGQDAIEADENCSLLFGLPIGQFPRTIEEFAALVHQDDRERVQQEVDATVERGAEYNTEFRVVWPEGAVRSLAACAKVYYSEAGQPLRLTGVCWDVTERKFTEAALERERSLFPSTSARKARSRRLAFLMPTSLTKCMPVKRSRTNKKSSGRANRC
jgi:PAS domain S-box-containing protein